MNMTFDLSFSALETACLKASCFLLVLEVFSALNVWVLLKMT